MLPRPSEKNFRLFEFSALSAEWQFTQIVETRRGFSACMTLFGMLRNRKTAFMGKAQCMYAHCAFLVKDKKTEKPQAV